MFAPRVTLAKGDWIEFVVFLATETDSWKKILSGYYSVLRKIRPVLLSNEAINSYFFSYYGPEKYTQVTEQERYLKKLERIRDEKVVYVRVRINVAAPNRDKVIDSLARVLEAEKMLVSGFELLKDYDVLDDLGKRFCRNERGIVDHERTKLFVNYWNSGCNYIMSAIGDTPSWDRTVDAMGMPHLMFNALGGVFRISVKCQSCSEDMYIFTSKISGLNFDVKISELPLLPLYCINCNRLTWFATNL